MKVFDTFCFFNEYDLLELRFMELYDVVDYFVIVEANKTFSGKDKEFNFELNKDRFKKWSDKIIYHKVTDMPDFPPDDVWGREYYQRNCIWNALEGIAKNGDKILISDCDEIPNPDVLKANLYRTVRVTFRNQMFYYYVNNACRGRWCGTVMDTWGNFGPRIQSLRWFAIKNRYQRWVDYIIEDGGWHYSYLTGNNPEKIKEKIDSFSDRELLATAGSDEDIIYKLNHSKDLYNRDFKGRHKQHIIDITNCKPKHLDEWLKIHPQYFYAT